MRICLSRDSTCWPSHRRRRKSLRFGFHISHPNVYACEHTDFASGRNLCRKHNTWSSVCPSEPSSVDWNRSFAWKLHHIADTSRGARQCDGACDQTERSSWLIHQHTFYTWNAVCLWEWAVLYCIMYMSNTIKSDIAFFTLHLSACQLECSHISLTVMPSMTRSIRSDAPVSTNILLHRTVQNLSVNTNWW